MYEFSNRVGKTVAKTDMTLKGVVLQQFGKRNEIVIVRHFDFIERRYVKSRLYLHGLMTVNNDWADKDTNTYDIDTVRMTNEVLREAALIANDRALFDSTFEKKEKA